MNSTAPSHPQMIDLYHLVATDRDGNALYGYRNWRMGGRSFKLRTPEGIVRSWDDWTARGKTVARKAPAGRWSWNEDGREGFR